MAAVAKFRDDNSGSITTGGTSTAYTASSNQGFDTLAHLDQLLLQLQSVFVGDEMQLVELTRPPHSRVSGSVVRHIPGALSS